MRDIWLWIDEHGLEGHAPEMLAQRSHGADERRIETAGSELGVALPDDVKASLRAHDGQRDWTFVAWLSHFVVALEADRSPSPTGYARARLTRPVARGVAGASGRSAVV